MNFLGKYMQIKKRNAKIAWKKAKMSKTCYLFLLPYLIVFTAFYILPVLMSVFYSFTYYNVLEPARFVGVDNYINLLLADDVFLIAVKNTFLLAAITGPLGYIMAFLFAWFINELPRYIRAFAVVVFKFCRLCKFNTLYGNYIDFKFCRQTLICNRDCLFS